MYTLPIILFHIQFTLAVFLTIQFMSHSATETCIAVIYCMLSHFIRRIYFNNHQLCYFK